jgi:dienelactone hydrolase
VGATLQWRSEPDRRAERYGKRIRFGNLRDKGFGYMSYSERVGPGIVIAHDEFGAADWLEGLADSLTAEGFTVLVPDLYSGTRPRTVDEAQRMASVLADEGAARLIEAAADHLRDNWHPRLGLIGYATGADLAAELAERRPVDAAVLFYGTRPPPGSAPALVHLCEGSIAEASGAETEMMVHAAPRHFANPRVSAYHPDAEAEARAATIEFFRYHLS